MVGRSKIQIKNKTQGDTNCFNLPSVQKLVSSSAQEHSSVAVDLKIKKLWSGLFPSYGLCLR